MTAAWPPGSWAVEIALLKTDHADRATATPPSAELGWRVPATVWFTTLGAGTDVPAQVVGRASAVIWWWPALAMSRVAPGAATSAWGS